MKKVRISLNLDDYGKLIELLDKRGGKTLKKIIEESVEDYKEVLENKKNSTGKATAKKIEIVKEKIIRAVEDLKKDDKEINNYSISKQASISYNTTRKYSDFIKSIIKG